jgi:proline iminopeptidase
MTVPEVFDSGPSARPPTSTALGSRARLAVRDHGGNGPVVLLLHGGPGCPDYLEPVAELLGPDVRVVSLDQRGVGGSTCDGGYEAADYVADVEAVREHIGADQIHLLGHSWGGVVAQLYLHAHPDRVGSLCLLNSAAGVGVHWVATEREVLAYNRRRSGWRGFAALGAWSVAAYLPGPVGKLAGRRILDRVWRNYFPVGSFPPAADRTWLAGANRIAARRTVRAIKTMPASTLDALGAHSELPVLTVYGDDDIYGPSITHLRDRYPAARHIVVPGCGHLPWLQAPQAFEHLIRDFYETTAGASSVVDRTA